MVDGMESFKKSGETEQRLMILRMKSKVTMKKFYFIQKLDGKQSR